MQDLGEIVIDKRYNGPPNSGNGGYCAGRAAAFLAGPATVELRAPPPLDTPLKVCGDADGVEIFHDDVLVMRARTGGPELAPPPSPGLEMASKGAEKFAGINERARPICFVCGSLREAGDGLRIFAGDVDGFDGVADVWTPHEAFGDQDGLVRPEFIWAALDCPSAFAVANLKECLVLLGRISVKIDKRPPVGEPLVVTAWKSERDGRKRPGGSALFTADGELVAHSEALWIEVQQGEW